MWKKRYQNAKPNLSSPSPTTKNYTRATVPGNVRQRRSTSRVRVRTHMGLRIHCSSGTEHGRKQSGDPSLQPEARSISGTLHTSTPLALSTPSSPSLSWWCRNQRLQLGCLRSPVTVAVWSRSSRKLQQRMPVPMIKGGDNSEAPIKGAS